MYAESLSAGDNRQNTAFQLSLSRAEWKGCTAASFALVLCCSRSLDSFSFGLSCSKGNCVYFTTRSMTPWLLSYFELQENQKGMNLEHRENRWEEIHWRRCSGEVYSSKAGAFITLPRPMNPVVSPRGSALEPSSSGAFFSVQTEQEASASVLSCCSKVHYSAPWLLPPLHPACRLLFGHFAACWHCCQTVGSRGN